MSMVVNTMVEMAKAHRLHPYSYLRYLYDSRPSTDTSAVALANLAPWSEKVRMYVTINRSKMLTNNPDISDWFGANVLPDTWCLRLMFVRMLVYGFKMVFIIKAHKNLGSMFSLMLLHY